MARRIGVVLEHTVIDIYSGFEGLQVTVIIYEDLPNEIFKHTVPKQLQSLVDANDPEDGHIFQELRIQGREVQISYVLPE